jgi:hypothetical protein
MPRTKKAVASKNPNTGFFFRKSGLARLPSREGLEYEGGGVKAQ